MIRRKTHLVTRVNYLCLTYSLYFTDGNLEFYRIPGVLQRFGICYLFVAMMQLLLSPTNNREKKVQDSFHFNSQLNSIYWKSRDMCNVMLQAVLEPIKNILRRSHDMINGSVRQYGGMPGRSD